MPQLFFHWLLNHSGGGGGLYHQYGPKNKIDIFRHLWHLSGIWFVKPPYPRLRRLIVIFIERIQRNLVFQFNKWKPEHWRTQRCTQENLKLIPVICSEDKWEKNSHHQIISLLINPTWHLMAKNFLLPSDVRSDLLLQFSPSHSWNFLELRNRGVGVVEPPYMGQTSQVSSFSLSGDFAWGHKGYSANTAWGSTFRFVVPGLQRKRSSWLAHPLSD